MSLMIKNGFVEINETSEKRMMDFHLKHGFAVLTAFQCEYSLSENRDRNRQLAGDLKTNGFSYIKITAGCAETILPDNINWNNADIIAGDDLHRQYQTMAESLLVPMINIKTKEKITDFESFKNIIIKLGIKYEQDFVLISPPEELGSASYIMTNSPSGDLESVDCSFNNLSAASAADIYFSMKEKMMNKALAKRKDRVVGIKFETFWVDEPAQTISGVRMRDNRNEIAPFGSHYYNNSSIYKELVELYKELVEHRTKK